MDEWDPNTYQDLSYYQEYGAMESLSAVQRDLLFILAGTTRPDGPAIREALQSYYNSPVSDGQLYPNLNKLADNGFIEKTAVNRRRTRYDLTKKGELAIAARTDWQATYLADANEPEAPDGNRC